MDQLTKKDLNEALQPLATKSDLRPLSDGISAIRKDIKPIHQDLIEHDKRAEEVTTQINELLDLKRLEEKFERLRQNIREKLHVEV